MYELLPTLLPYRQPSEDGIESWSEGPKYSGGSSAAMRTQSVWTD
jgi:hypothetical protein